MMIDRDAENERAFNDYYLSNGWPVPAGGWTGAGKPAQELRETPATEEYDLFIDWPEFWSRDRTAADWLLEDVLARGRGHSIYAPHKVGKSLLLLWCSMQLVKAGTVVIYLDYEMGEDDLHERLEDMGCDAETDLALLRYALLPSLPPLDKPEGGAAMLELVDREHIAHPDRHIAVVIDTIGRATLGEENNNDTIRDFYRYTGLGLKQRGCTWVRLDHAGWDASKGARGASAKGDDVDVIWRLAATDGGLELHRVAARMGWVPAVVALGMTTEPVLGFAPVSESWPLGTFETAAALGSVGVPARRVHAGRWGGFEGRW